MQHPEIDDHERIEAETTDRASGLLVREAIKAFRLNNFEQTLETIESFLFKIELFDPDVAFDGAAQLLMKAADAFSVLDENHDKRLSPDELRHQADLCQRELKEALTWILAHFDAIQRLRPTIHTEGLSRHDLITVSDFFLGLNFAHVNFEAIARHQHDGKKALTARDLESYLLHHHDAIGPREQHGLRTLKNYLTIYTDDGELTDDELVNVELPGQDDTFHT